LEIGRRVPGSDELVPLRELEEELRGGGVADVVEGVEGLEAST
jgi:hypothetical protein